MEHSKVRFPQFPYRFTDHIYLCLFAAVVDAHDKANALHQDMSLDNIILYRDEDGTPRAGYLINWEHKRNVDDTPVDIFNLPVCRTPLCTCDYL